MNEDKASRYHRLRRQGAIGSLAWSSALLIFLLVTPASRALRDLAEQFVRTAGLPGPTGLAVAVAFYVASVAVIHGPLALALAFCRGFLLERRYGLSTEPLGAWLLDRIKETVLSLLIAVGSATIVLVSQRTWPAGWWIASGAAFVLVTILLVNLAPILLLPIFYRLEPLGRESLRRRLVALTRRVGAAALDAYEWKLGNKSRRANAALVGLGRTRRILVSDTLLAEYSDDEIEVILAHELGHHVHGDIWKTVALDAVVIVGGLGLAHAALRRLGPGLGLSGWGDLAALPLVALAIGAVALAALPVVNGVSRGQERRADAFALRTTGHPQAFISAMRRIGDQNLAELDPPRAARLLLLTHPPLAERLASARQWPAGSDPEGLIVG